MPSFNCEKNIKIHIIRIIGYNNDGRYIDP